MTTTTGESFEEWYKRLVRIAGPDDPIYSSGLTMSSVRLPTGSTRSTPPSSDGRTSSPSSASADPMQGAVDQIEASLRSKIERIDKLTPEQYARYMAGEPLNTLSPLPGFTTPEKNDRN